MDNIAKFNLNEKTLFESAEKRYQSDDPIGALTMLNKRAERYAPSADACALYADIYEDLGLWDCSADAWYRFLDTCNEADFTEGYEGLAIAYMNLGQELLADHYYRCMLERGDSGYEPDSVPGAETEQFPPLQIVDSDPADQEALARGFEYIRSGEYDKAREKLGEVSPESKDYFTAAELIAAAYLFSGQTDEAAEQCRKVLELYPDDINALTTYCGVLSRQGDKEEARKAGLRLAAIETESTEELARVATILCDMELYEESYQKITAIKDKVYEADPLWLHAVAAYHTGRVEEAISVLETFMAIYPRKAVANYYLIMMREYLDGGKEVPIRCAYRLPDKKRDSVVKYFKLVDSYGEIRSKREGKLEQFRENCRLAFDIEEGPEDFLHRLAADCAIKCGADDVVREFLLDVHLPDGFKRRALVNLVLRNEENSFGVVLTGVYREFYTHRIELGPRRAADFLFAFALVYGQYAILGEEAENKIIAAAEDVYQILEEADALDYCLNTEAAAAVIYREARLPNSTHGLDEICKAFEASPADVKEILDLII